ncbi:MAG: branched-chain amino acid ABC transporter permease [Ilumatobacteraceae bacterium]
MIDYVNAVLQGILLGGLYALFATGLSLAFGVMRFVNLAHGDLAVLGAYLILSTSTLLGVSPWLALPIVIVGGAGLGFVTQAGLFNRTLGDNPMPSILVTFGLGVVIQNGLLEHYSATQQRLDIGSIVTKSVSFGKISLGVLPLVILATAIVLLAVLEVALRTTRFGRAFRATADDARTAQLSGIDDRVMYASAMGISFATLAIAGFFLGSRTTFAPAVGPALLLFGFEAVVIGGIGSLWGTLLGGVVLGVSQTLANQISIGWDLLAGHLVFLAILLFRPNGLLGAKQ